MKTELGDASFIQGWNAMNAIQLANALHETMGAWCAYRISFVDFRRRNTATWAEIERMGLTGEVKALLRREAQVEAYRRMCPTASSQEIDEAIALQAQS